MKFKPHRTLSRKWPIISAFLGSLLLLVPAPQAIAQEGESVFGRRESSESALIGIIYDLKQTQQRHPSEINPNNYSQVVEEFLRKNWDESVLNRYFRSARPLYTTQIFVPLMTADNAPKAFDMQAVIKPAVWLVHYKGQVAPPADGVYRFAGYSDDLIAVAINDKTVCIGGRMDLDKVWKSPERRAGPSGANGSLTYGDWIPLKKDQPVDLDVIIGERPGGQFCAFLLYEKQGASYPADASGKPLLPIFQLAPHDTPAQPPKLAPPFSPATETWKSFQ
ncbi:MAG TPA: hypothetical protein VIS74_01780 [Chthoniobacterales bacterium]